MEQEFKLPERIEDEARREFIKSVLRGTAKTELEKHEDEHESVVTHLADDEEVKRAFENVREGNSNREGVDLGELLRRKIEELKQDGRNI